MTVVYDRALVAFLLSCNNLSSLISHPLYHSNLVPVTFDRTRARLSKSFKAPVARLRILIIFKFQITALQQ
jgi:hypothetical protein